MTFFIGLMSITNHKVQHRLTAITDIDYRVLRLKPGAYQVAFAYADDLERDAKLAQIESATGLRVAEVSP